MPSHLIADCRRLMPSTVRRMHGNAQIAFVYRLLSLLSCDYQQFKHEWVSRKICTKLKIEMRTKRRMDVNVGLTFDSIGSFRCKSTKRLHRKSSSVHLPFASIFGSRFFFFACFVLETVATWNGSKWTILLCILIAPTFAIFATETMAVCCGPTADAVDERPTTHAVPSLGWTER